MHGGGGALPLLDELATDPRLADYPYLPATRADLLRRLGDAAAGQRARFRRHGVAGVPTVFIG